MVATRRSRWGDPSQHTRSLRCAAVYTSRYSEATRSEATSGARPVADRTYSELKRRLLFGDFPLGRRLGEVALGEMLGVSRSPVRESLSRLHAEGLVVRLPEGGFAPATPDLHTVAELYEVRRSLEFSALHRGTHDPEQLEAIRADWSQMTAPATDAECAPDFVLHDEDFHIALALASGNAALAEVLESVNVRIRFVRMHDFLTVNRVKKTISEHLGIVTALLRSDSELASKRLDRHLHVSTKVVEQRAALALSRMISGGSQ